MADELVVNISLRYSPAANVQQIQRDLANQAFTVAGVPKYLQQIQIIGTSREALNLGEISTCGVIWVKNLDNTNYVELFPDAATSSALVKIKPGEAWAFRLASNTPYAQANTAQCSVEILLMPD